MGVIIDGKYYRDKPAPATSQPSTTVAGINEQGKLQQLYRSHAHELIQPNNPDGSINKAFADYYPEDAKNHGHVPESEEL